MENYMTVEECRELTGDSALFIRKKLEVGEYVGKCVGSRKRKTYKISRYWLYSNVLYWSEWKIKEYHQSPKGRYWLAYDPEESRRKKEPIAVGSNIIVN